MALASSGAMPSLAVPGKARIYILLSAFVFAFFAAQAMSISLLSNWLKSTLSLAGEQTSVVMGSNFVACLIVQPFYGHILDKIGLKKQLLWFLALMAASCAPFYIFAYEPLLKLNLLVGAAAGGAYLSVTLVAGSFALESYVDRLGRTYGFEYSRVRLWGALGFASAAFFSGTLFKINPRINFCIASAMAIILVLVVFSRWT